MRTHKYRAWEDGKMHYNVRVGGVVDGEETTPAIWSEEYSYGYWEHLNEQPYTVLMQYTGKDDLNGVEIYEGDILISPNKLWTGVVEYDLLDLAFKLIVDGVRITKSREMNKFDEWLVAGNIYENSDLAQWYMEGLL